MSASRTILVAAAIVALVGTAATAKWKLRYAESPSASWFEAQKDCKGGSCCGRADGEPYYDSYDQNSDGSVTLSNGTKVDSCKVLKGPNPTGHAIWWRSGDTTYCFSPGPGF